MNCNCFLYVSDVICVVAGTYFELEISHYADGDKLPIDVSEFDVSIFSLTQKDEFTLLWSATPKETKDNIFNSGTFNIFRTFEGNRSAFLTGIIKITNP